MQLQKTKKLEQQMYGKQKSQISHESGYFLEVFGTIKKNTAVLLLYELILLYAAWVVG